MKRIHLFEFEDFAWFPGWLRECMTNYIFAFHKILDTKSNLKDLVSKALEHSQEKKIIDLCSGGTGPMLDVAQELDTDITFTDLYPNTKAAKKVSELNNEKLHYSLDPVNAADVDQGLKGVRTMICSMHHMRPEVAKAILKDAMDAKQPICIYEISDNSMPPTPLWWLAFPINIISTFFVTFMVRPLTFTQLFFTYVIPLLPIFIAWDGAVSNARTYTLSDMDILLEGLNSEDYKWEKGALKGPGGNKLYLMGLPMN